MKLFVTTGEIPKRAAAALDYQGDPAVLASGLTVEEVPEAQALTISTTSADGARAAQVANTFAAETVRYFDEGHQGTGDAQLSILQEATAIPAESAVALRLPAGRIPRTALAALLGLIVGFGVALILDRFDSRLRTRQEVHEAISMPVVAQVPRLKRADRVPGRLGVVAEPLGEYANGYRAARTALMHLPGQQVQGEWTPQDATAAGDGGEFQPARVILVSSAFESEGKTTSVANLAASFAETGQSVLVLDCDLRSPDAHNQFDVPQGAGISDHLVQAASESIQPLIRPTNVSGVYIMTAGTRLDHPAALTSRLEPILAEARQLADVVIVDTAPLLAASDVFDVLPLVDTVLLVVRSGRLTEQAGQRVAELLGRFQVPVTGAILIGAPARRAEGYGSRYGYGYGDDPRKKQRKAARVKEKPAELASAEPPTESRPAQRSLPEEASDVDNALRS
ncbi:tyrosine-protein kinase family protein [Granulicoccus sp. GXG6511]|uniref:tyrosine-protein kinase family protein n=1 Tax=Granulicoccus sp. GXG6511 TaxID=3381351 RepID=UPI003D7EDB52